MLKHLFAIVIGVSAMLPVSAGEVSVIDTSTDINTNGGWWPGLEIPRSVFIEAGAGSTFVFDYTINEGCADAKFRITANWSNTLLPGFVPGPGIYGRKQIEIIRTYSNEHQRIKYNSISIHLVLFSIIFAK